MLDGKFAVIDLPEDMVNTWQKKQRCIKSIPYRFKVWYKELIFSDWEKFADNKNWKCYKKKQGKTEKNGSRAMEKLLHGDNRGELLREEPVYSSPNVANITKNTLFDSTFQEQKRSTGLFRTENWEPSHHGESRVLTHSGLSLYRHR